MTTVDTVTNRQIRELQDAAGETADYKVYWDCERALNGSAAALARVVAAIQHAEAQSGSDDGNHHHV